MYEPSGGGTFDLMAGRVTKNTVGGIADAYSYQVSQDPAASLP